MSKFLGSRSGILSDGSIRRAVTDGLLVIEPFNPNHVQPSSYDITLGGIEPLVLEPWKFKLAATAEWFEFPDCIEGQVQGRSSIGRLGVLIHFTAGKCDPGWRGRITLECMACDKEQIFYPGDRIGQVTFNWLDMPVEQPYTGRYQDDIGVVESKFEHGER